MDETPREQKMGLITFDDVAVIFSGEEWEMLNEQQRTLYMEVMKENYEHFLFLGYKVPIILSWQQNRKSAVKATAQQTVLPTSAVTQGTEIVDKKSADGSCRKTRAMSSHADPPELPRESEYSIRLRPKRPRQDETEDNLNSIQNGNQNQALSSPRIPKERTKLCCPQCDKCFRYSSALEAHLRVHNGDKPHKCELCSETFSYKSELIVHRRKHSRTSSSVSQGVENMIPLEVTIKPSSRNSTPKSARNTKTRTKRGPYKKRGVKTVNGEAASITGSTSSKPSKTATAENTNSIRTFEQAGKAASAPQTTSTNSEASKMVATQETISNITNGHGEKEKPLKCNFCEKRFNSPFILEAHNRIHTGKLAYACQFCDESFSKASLLCAHSSKHKESKPFQCDQCERNFKDETLFLAHKRTHTGEKSHQCSKCSDWFPNRNSLLAHEESHLKPKPYKCQHCEKSFNDKALLITHEGVHTDTKPFRCNQCSESFFLKTQLFEHQTKHAPDKPFPCTKCEKSFNKKETLIAHNRVHSLPNNPKSHTR